MAYTVEEAKKLVIEAGLKLQNEGLIVRTWGNISARISDKQFVITPSGRGYDSLTPDDIVVVNIKNCEYEGNIKPSSECGAHADVYKLRPDVNFVVHTHQTYASVLSVIGCDVELTDDEQKFLGDRIPCAEYGMSSSEALRKQIRKTLRKAKKCNSMLLRNHGVLCMGTDFDNAFEISSVMEQICKYKYEEYTRTFVAELAEDFMPEDDGEETIEAMEEDLKDNGYIDYGISHFDRGVITLTINGEDYEYNLENKKPAGRNPKSRAVNKIAAMHAKIYENSDAKCIYHVTLPNIIDISTKTKNVEAFIDDQAQIVGEVIKCVGKVRKKPHFESSSSIVRGLKDNGAVLIAGQGALCVGGSESDVEATAYVLEKGCMAAKLAECHPFAKAVPGRIAKKERAFYRDTYSKLK